MYSIVIDVDHDFEFTVEWNELRMGYFRNYLDASMIMDALIILVEVYYHATVHHYPIVSQL